MEGCLSHLQSCSAPLLDANGSRRSKHAFQMAFLMDVCLPLLVRMSWVGLGEAGLSRTELSGTDLGGSELG